VRPDPLRASTPTWSCPLRAAACRAWHATAHGAWHAAAPWRWPTIAPAPRPAPDPPGPVRRPAWHGRFRNQGGRRLDHRGHPAGARRVLVEQPVQGSRLDGLLHQQQVDQRGQHVAVAGEQCPSRVDRLVQQGVGRGVDVAGQWPDLELLRSDMARAERAHAELGHHAPGDLSGRLEVVGRALGEVVAEVQLLCHPAGQGDQQPGPRLTSGQEQPVTACEPGDAAGPAPRHDSDLHRLVRLWHEQAR
jgi:hypothetical protein